ncbi:hypothetical protein SAMN05421541_119160 [Actinoplanes philippinensis]|uniref:Alpha/beta hydrolase family protein n=1 Tax=Actinoplanes philippinensis TaxID=35752 RepID=A0A1I2L1P2_9ACTN|nr:hypothetical protein SAMN05421541_119160 [Actinoplanes philippinensis]
MRPQDAPNDQTRQILLSEGYATLGSSYSGPTLWALETAVDDRFAALGAFTAVLGAQPRRTIAVGRSMGGLVSARQAPGPRGRIDRVHTTCGIVAGCLNLNNYQLDGLHAIVELPASGRTIPLVRHESPQQAAQAATVVVAAVSAAQATPPGRARIAPAAALFNVSGGAGPPAALHVLEHRLDRGRRPGDPAAFGTGYPGGEARFVRFAPGPLVGGLGEPGRGSSAVRPTAAPTSSTLPAMSRT